MQLSRSILWMSLSLVAGCLSPMDDGGKTDDAGNSPVDDAGVTQPLTDASGFPPGSNPDFTTPGSNPTPDFSTPGKPAIPYVYIGSANAQIGVYKLDRSTGALTSVDTTALANGAPTFLAVDPQHKYLYAANEVQTGGVSAYSINQATGKLTHLNDQPMANFGPTHVSVDQAGKFVFAANYNTGHVASYPIQADGKVGTAADDKQPGTNAHQAVTDPSNKFVFVPCLGSDYVAQFTLNATSGVLTANTPATLGIGPPAGQPNQVGPRHMAFHPNGKWIYLALETASQVAPLLLDTTTGRLSAMQTPLSSLTAPVAGNTEAEVQVHPNGKFVYSSNRGDNSIALFTVGATGQLSFVSTKKTGGATPRHFSIDPSGAWLLVAHQGSGNVGVFAIDPTSGALTAAAGGLTNFATPEFISVVELPAP